MNLLSRIRLFATLQTVAYQAPPSVGFSREEYWSGLPFISPKDLPDPGIEPRCPPLWADALPSEPPRKPVQFSSVKLYSHCCETNLHNSFNIVKLKFYTHETSTPHSPLHPASNNHHSTFCLHEFDSCTGHNKHLLPTTQEKTLYMDITRWSTPKSD